MILRLSCPLFLKQFVSSLSPQWKTTQGISFPTKKNLACFRVIIWCFNPPSPAYFLAYDSICALWNTTFCWKRWQIFSLNVHFSTFWPALFVYPSEQPIPSSMMVAKAHTLGRVQAQGRCILCFPENLLDSNPLVTLSLSKFSVISLTLSWTNVNSAHLSRFSVLYMEWWNFLRKNLLPPDCHCSFSFKMLSCCLTKFYLVTVDPTG